MGSAGGCQSIHSHATEDGKESSSESESSHNEGDSTEEDGNAEEDKGGIETSSDGQVAPDGKEGLECPHTQDTLTSISQVPKHGKTQPNHPNPVGPPLDYMGECQVFDGIQSDIYDLC